MNRITFIFALFFALALAGCDAKDTCLDQGGHYNETTKQCEQ
ncbi:lipoprotein [Neisseria montereyensis]|uniref:Lipoprotein n=1 Tax=Neisseria montereyensis TaxID=2973938 RepID=A0ABT2FE74_9NEIS|nr:lipoprotein [Neisseria montereyensis]MCS4534516.1 lipoprotein [Neisseria montereyensis]